VATHALVTGDPNSSEDGSPTEAVVSGGTKRNHIENTVDGDPSQTGGAAVKRRITVKSSPLTVGKAIVERRNHDVSNDRTGDEHSRKKQRLEEEVEGQQPANLGSVGSTWPAAPTPASCSSTELCGWKFDTSVTGMAFADRRFPPVLVGVERPKSK
jgi:hypothetical protein